jgi:hypothetical protein
MKRQDDLLSAVAHSLGIYGTAPACYLSARARVPSFRLEDLDRAIEIDRSLVRVRAMRYAVHSVHLELLQVAWAATRRPAMYPNSYRKQLAGVYPELSGRVVTALIAGPITATGRPRKGTR